MKIPSDIVPGTEFNTIDYGKLKIIKYDGKMKVTVEFLDTGYQTVAQAEHVRRGRVKDKLKPSVYGVGFVGVGPLKPQSIES